MICQKISQETLDFEKSPSCKSKNILLSVRNVGVVFNRNRSIFKKKEFEAIKNVSFDVHAGESIGIIGHNGAGKSTLLSLLAGIIKPDRGRVINYGVKVSLLSLYVGFVNELSGLDNIVLSGLALGFPKTDIYQKIDSIIEFSGIEEHINYPVRTYSTGMRARLGFSITHLLQTDVLLIDETLGVGDKDFQQKSTKAMKEKIKSDQTVILVSHNAGVIKELCDRSIWIEKGAIVAEGPTGEVVDRYQNEKQK